MISFLTAQKIHRRNLGRGPVRLRRLGESLGCACGRDILAREDSPAFDKAMMDGFAVCSNNANRPGTMLAVSGRVFAGAAPRSLKPGTCCKIATGAAVPLGADAVVKKEDCRYSRDGRVSFFEKVRPGENILRRAAHFKKGDKIFSQGETVNAAGVALAASQGISSLPVFSPPVVALLSTGDEVAEAGRRKKRFGIWNATGPMLNSVLMASGAKLTGLGTSGDDENKLSALIRQGLRADILIVTGAVSAGERDIVPRLLKKAGVKILFHRVRMKPGKPVLFGKGGRTLVYGLPGNPVSTLVTYSVFVKPAIEYWKGGSGELLLEKGFMKDSFVHSTDRFSFLPARLRMNKGFCQMAPLVYHDSADLRTAAQADGFFVYDSKLKRLAKGAPVVFLRVNR